MSNQDIDIQEINKNLQENYIHYNLDRVDYTINNLELGLIEKSGSSIWKDFFIATLAVAIPSLLNAYHEYNNLTEQVEFSIELFLNCLVGSICLILSVICLIVWRNNRNSFKQIIKQIKDKPKYRLPKSAK